MELVDTTFKIQLIPVVKRKINDWNSANIQHVRNKFVKQWNVIKILRKQQKTYVPWPFMLMAKSNYTGLICFLRSQNCVQFRVELILLFYILNFK